MPRCELTGKQPEVKNLVSHSNIKTKSVAFPNVNYKRVFSPLLNQMVRLKMASSTIRSMEHMGGFDKFLLNQPDKVLSKKALEFKTRMLRKLRAPKKAAAPAAEAAPKEAKPAKAVKAKAPKKTAKKS